MTTLVNLGIPAENASDLAVQNLETWRLVAVAVWPCGRGDGCF